MSKGELLLLAPDDSPWARRLTDELNPLGFLVHRVADVDEAWQVMGVSVYDAILIQADQDLAADCLYIRILRERSAAPVIMLGPNITSSQRISYYRAGADLYLAWPLHDLEIVARFSGVLRRSRMNARAQAQVGGLGQEGASNGFVGTN